MPLPLSLKIPVSLPSVKDTFFICIFQVKIWFQNRRARERRDKASPNDLAKTNKPTEFASKQPAHLPVHLHSSPYPPMRMPGIKDEHTVVNTRFTPNPLHSMLQTQWNYYHAIHGLYNYRSLPAQSLQQYLAVDRHRAPQLSSVISIRQSAFSPEPAEDIESNRLTP